MKRPKLKIYAPLLLLAAVFFLTSHVSAQDELNPIRWTLKTADASVKSGEPFKVQLTATIDEGWHLYSLEQPSGGPIPTRITLPPEQNFKLAGDIESPVPQVVFDQNFNLDTQFYESEAVFILPVAAAKDSPIGKTTIAVNAFFQTCNNETCLPPKTVKLTAEVEVTGASLTAVKYEIPANKAALPIASDPIEFTFVDFAGKSRKLSEFRGKYVLLDFWATWCRPCLADIPKLKELYEAHKANNFEIIGMDSETIGDDSEAPDPEFAKETAARAKQIVTTRGVTWTQATAATAVPVATKVFSVKSLPTKILLDKEGKIIATIGEKDDLKAVVEKLLSEQK